MCHRSPQSQKQLHGLAIPNLSRHTARRAGNAHYGVWDWSWLPFNSRVEELLKEIKLKEIENNVTVCHQLPASIRAEGHAWVWIANKRNLEQSTATNPTQTALHRQENG